MDPDKPLDLDALLELAGSQAKMVMIDLGEALTACFLIVRGDGKVDIISTPWQDEREKEKTAVIIRNWLRKYDARAYSLLTEAWAAEQPEGWTPGQPRGLPPAERPDRIELVIAMAVSRTETKWRRWLTVRNSAGRVTELVPDAMAGEKTSWLANLFDD